MVSILNPGKCKEMVKDLGGCNTPGVKEKCEAILKEAQVAVRTILRSKRPNETESARQEVVRCIRETKVMKKAHG
jgi:hypothetical protein